MFADRAEAGERLARALKNHHGSWRLVLGIPGGGLLVAAHVAQRLGGDLDVVLVRKLRAPGAPEFAIGSIDEAGWAWVAPHARGAGATPEYIAQERERQLHELRRQRALYTPGRPALDARGRTALLVDDGMTTGTTMVAALQAVRHQQPQRLVCAVAVAPHAALDAVRPHADEVVCVRTPVGFAAVGQFYRRFPQVGDDEVVAVLRAARAPAAGDGSGARAEA